MLSVHVARLISKNRCNHMEQLCTKKLMISAFALALSGCGESPVTVEPGQNSFWGGPQLQITSVADKVTVEKIEVNRGNCKVNSQEALPHQLVLGTSFKVDAPSCQNVLEVSVATSDGSFDFSFK